MISEGGRVGGDQLDALRQSFRLIEHFELDNATDRAKLGAALMGAWGVMAGSESYTAELLDHIPTLRVIARCGVGVDAIDVNAATERGVVVCTTPDANSDGVADMTITLMLACLKRIVLADRCVRDGRWRPPELSGDLCTATVGLVGLGRIGRQVVRRLQGFDCRVLAVEPAPDEDFCRKYSVQLCSLEALLPEVDILSLHVPLTNTTRGLIGKHQFAKMKAGAVIVNTSRGAIIKEEALIEALGSGLLAAAGLDVFEDEPLRSTHRLVSLDNVVLSGHAASFSRLSVGRILDGVCRNLLGAARGELPYGCINPEAWHRHRADAPLRVSQ
jgi:phosphoglycerate dehydrogenase-like enzyme